MATTAATRARTRDSGSDSAPGDEERRLDRLERLTRLRADGILDDDEFRAEKARIMSGEGPV